MVADARCSGSGSLGGRDLADLFAEDGAQTRTGAMQAGSHGALGRRQAMRDLLEAEVLVVVERDDVAVLRRQLVEGGPHDGVALALRRMRVRAVAQAVGARIVRRRETPEVFEVEALDEPRACGFAGRLWLDGRGVVRDARRGIEMLVHACDGGVAMACAVTASWLGDASHADEIGHTAQDLLARVEGQRTCLLGQAEACFQIGVLFYYGRDSFPRDRAKSSRAFARGCDLGDSRACNNIGAALAYGDGVGRDVENASIEFLKACRLGEALGCANLGYMTEHGEGVTRDRSRARVLYREACSSGDVYGCLHVALLEAEDAGAPRAPGAALAHWRQRCDAGHDARACAFVGVMYEDGPDGIDRDEEKSLEAMTRACSLGNGPACEWVRSHPD